MSKRILPILNVLVAVIFIATTLIEMPSFNDLAFRTSTLIIVATSWNLMANAGLVSLGHSAFWGVGSYVSLLVANAHLPLAASLVLALMAGAFLGILLAVATARLRGFFFAICTLGLSEGLRVTCLMLPDVTGGAVGLFLDQAARPSLKTLFFLGAVGAVLTALLAVWLSRTRFHYACRAMRNHEGAAQMLGVDPRPYRASVMALSGALGAGAGAINAMYGGYIDPSIAFTLRVTIESQIAPILGGLYTVAGPVLGSVLIVTLSEWTRLTFGANEGLSQLIFGALLVLAILFMPLGIVGLWRRLTRRIPKQNLPAVNDLAASKPKGAGA
jgi:branched-chain amino acid transport system permease protein